MAFEIGVGQTLVCLGDSITEALEGYVRIMANMIAAEYPERRIRVLNAGVGGNRAPDMRARLETDVIAPQPDWVTINVGINDVWHGFSGFGNGPDFPEGNSPNGVPLDIYEMTVTDIVRELQARAQAALMLLTPTIIGEDAGTPENRKLEGYVEAMERVGQATGVPVCPLHREFLDTLRRGKAADPTYSLTVDGVHPNMVGHIVISMTVLEALGFFDGMQPVR